MLCDTETFLALDPCSLSALYLKRELGSNVTIFAVIKAPNSGDSSKPTSRHELIDHFFSPLVEIDRQFVAFHGGTRP